MRRVWARVGGCIKWVVFQHATDYHTNRGGLQTLHVSRHATHVDVQDWGLTQASLDSVAKVYFTLANDNDPSSKL